MKTITKILIVALMASASAEAVAAPILYQPQNPSFGGFAGNDSALMARAALNRPKEKSSSSSSLSAEDALAQRMKENVLFSIANQFSQDAVDASKSSGNLLLNDGSSMGYLLNPDGTKTFTIYGRDGSVSSTISFKSL